MNAEKESVKVGIAQTRLVVSLVFVNLGLMFLLMDQGVLTMMNVKKLECVPMECV